MTIQSETNSIAYTGNGVTVAFAYPYPFHAAADLVVISTVIATGVQTTKALTTDYTVSGTADALGHYPNGGTVTAVVAPASTVTWTIYNDPDLTQTVDLVENDPLPAETLEAALDRLTMISQRLKTLVSRSLRQPDGDTADIDRLPAKVDRASKYAAWDADGDPIATAGTTSLAVISSFMETVLDDTTAAAARTTLGALGSNDGAVLASANTFTADQTIKSSDAGAAAGPALTLYRDSASPAASDVAGAVKFDGEDSAGNQDTYVQLEAEIADPTSTSEDGLFAFLTKVAGTLARRFKIGAGLYAEGLTDPGAGKINATDYQKSGVALPITLSYASANQTITAAGALTLAHGLGAMPVLIQARIKCLTAELGYSIGDELIISLQTSDATNAGHGVSIVPDATNISIRFGSQATSIGVTRKDTGAHANITNASWALIVRAWA